ncbi:MAG TPA: hypothetical protein QF630_06655 [Alphaproteobacteria bacterium]|nr:hypothetical protein [Alphaproteobacteria bacterium]
MVSTCQPPLRSIHEKYSIGELIGCQGNDAQTQVSDMVRGCRKIAADLDGYRGKLPAFLAENRWEAEAERLLQAVGKL